MRVMHVLEATGAGTARHVLELVRGLREQGLEIHLAYSPLRMDKLFSTGLADLQAAGVNLFELPMRRAPHPSDFTNLIRMVSYLRDYPRFNLIHGHSSKGGVMARLLGAISRTKVVYTPHAFVTLSPNLHPTERALYSGIERLLSFCTAALIAVSEDEAREAGRLGVPRSRVHVIPNGIPLRPPTPRDRAAVRDRWALPEGALAVGFVGRFASQKNPTLLLRAFAKLTSVNNQARLVMVGDGPLKPELESLARSLKISHRVVWTGFMEGRWAMAGFDLFALPSNYEGFPYVLLEALNAGLPVVTTAVGGTEMVVKDRQNGLVVPVGDVAAFAHALEALAADPELRQRFAGSSSKRAMEFSQDQMVERTLSLYRQLLF